MSGKLRKISDIPLTLPMMINSFSRLIMGKMHIIQCQLIIRKRKYFYLGIGSASVTQTFEIKGKYSLRDTIVNFDQNYKIYLLNLSSGDTLDVGYPNKYTGLYDFIVNPGSFKITYSGVGYLSQTIDTTILQDNPVLAVTIDVRLEKDTNYVKVPIIVEKPAEPVTYEKLNLQTIPTVAKIDSSILVMNMKVNDVTDKNINDADILYYTVQVMALHNPVDVSYFKYITDMKVLYNDQDKFYRYTTGKFKTKEEASLKRSELIGKGYPEEIFIKKVSKQ